MFGWTCSNLFILCYVPQIMKTVAVKDVSDVSLSMWVVQLIAYALGGTYAIHIKKWPMIYGYWMGFLVTGFFLYLYWMYS
jgi:uncharacterized protein with PQ loop repeat